jgi:hypothetical protein
MRSILRRTLMGLIALFVFSMLATNSARAVTPNPVLIFMGQDPATVRGENIIRYRYSVFNSSAFPNDLFAPAPALPPCGANTNSSRSWVDLFDQRGKRLNGFCALGNRDGLNGVWFGLPEGEIPPSWIYIEITDRQTETKYKSNLAETTL